MSQAEIETSGEVENPDFDPEGYVKEFYCGTYLCPLEGEVIDWIKNQLHKVFIAGTYRGKRILDVGSGPVVYPVITASAWFDEIYLSDLSKSNVAYLKKWMRGESEHMEYLMKEFAQKEGKEVPWEEKNNQVRNKVKGAVVWDMHKPEALSGTVLEGLQFDLVTTCLCMSAGNASFQTFTTFLKNVRKMIKPGGHLVIGDTLEISWYLINEEKFKAFGLTEQELRKAITESGYEIKLLETVKLGVYDNVKTDATSAFFLVAKNP